MTEFCTFHKKEHDHFEWRHTGDMWLCRDAISEIDTMFSQEPSASFNIGTSKSDTRVAHWKDIQSRVTTHDGQFLSGKAGREYQQKWSKKLLGKDLSKPADYTAPIYQKELKKAI